MESLKLISEIMLNIIAVYFSVLLLCNIIGIFCKKKQYPEAEPSNIAVMICARNEESVIGNLIDSLNRQDYPADKIKIFVVAHNCTDETARIARDKGATVFERNNPRETFKGHALNYGINELKSGYPGVFDILCVFDADNVAGRTFLKEINAAIKSGADVAQGFRNSKNYHKNAVTELFGAYWYHIMLSQNLPHSAMHLPATVGGTGFAVKMDAFYDGFKTDTMLEDIELTCLMVLAGKKCILAPHAMFYDEQPEKLIIGLRQRYRWSVGGYQVFRRYFPKLLRAVPKRGVQAAKMIFDILVNPVVLISFFGLFFRLIFCCAEEGFMGAVQYLASALALAWVGVLPPTLVMLARQRMNPFKNLWTILLFPYFLLISVIFSLPALLDRNPKWTPIPHTDTTAIEDIESTEK